MQTFPDSDSDNISIARDEKDLEDCIRRSVAEDTPLSIEGLGTKRAIGNVNTEHRRLSLEKLSGIVDYEPNELVLTARAGTPLSEIHSALSSEQQQLAFEPPDMGLVISGNPNPGTIGGLLATNLSGPRRFVAGAPRDHFLGVKGISGRGEPFKAGGRVVKNVTGYDMCKLLAGSYGTLAVMTEVTVKVLPAPETSVSLVVAGLDQKTAQKALTQWTSTPYAISGGAYLLERLTANSSVPEISVLDQSATIIRIEGTAVSVKSRADFLKQDLALSGNVIEIEDGASTSLWAEICSPQPGPGDCDLWRVSVPPSKWVHLLETLGRESIEDDPLVDWAGGLLWLRLPTDAEMVRERLFSAMEEIGGGSAVLVRPGSKERTPRQSFSPLFAGVHTLNRRLKENFDPKRILNPGRMYPDI